MKKEYYSMIPEEFKKYFETLKNGMNTIHIFESTNSPYFLYESKEINNSLLEINKNQFQLDLLFDSFSDYQKRMIEQTCFLDEIQSTNKTENIFSTRTDIFGLLQDKKVIQNKKIVSIINSYLNIKNENYNKLYNIQSIRELYDSMMENAYENSKDKPDGRIFRKGSVYISNGLKSVHSGFYPEEEIIKGMEEYTLFLKNNKVDEYLKLILSHFMIETIHPFYDGNGRFGRYLMSLELWNSRKTIFSLALASSINNHKKEYYDALKFARDIHEFGCLNEYVLSMESIFLDGIKNLKFDLEEKKDKLITLPEAPTKLTKTEYKIYKLIQEASVLTYFGINNEEIINICEVSKRTLMSTLQKLRELDLLMEMKLGKVQYHRAKIDCLLKDDSIII